MLKTANGVLAEAKSPVFTVPLPQPPHLISSGIYFYNYSSFSIYELKNTLIMLSRGVRGKATELVQWFVPDRTPSKLNRVFFHLNQRHIFLQSVLVQISAVSSNLQTGSLQVAIRNLWATSSSASPASPRPPRGKIPE